MRTQISQSVESAPVVIGRARQILSSDIDEFLRAVRGPREAAAEQVVRRLTEAGVSVEHVFLDLLAPTARRLGELWEQDACDFVEVTVALGRLQRVLRGLSRLFAEDLDVADATGSVLLTCLPGDQHTLGLFMVAEFFLRDGWLVNVGAPLGTGGLLDSVRREGFDLVGLSVSRASQLPTLERVIRDVRAQSRNPRVRVLVGGPPFAADPSLGDRVGADAAATDARQALRLARGMVAAHEGGG